MRVQMMTSISGGRGDGTDWPPAGGFLWVSQREGLELCQARLAVPAPEMEPPFETADAPDTGTEMRAAEPAAPLVSDPPDTGDASSVSEGEDEDPDSPGARATKQAWVEHAVNAGCDPAVATSMTKADLVARYGPGNP